MNATLPRATREELAHPAAPGQRHAQLVKVARALVGNGWRGGDIFSLLRPRYAADVPDSEISGVIRWAERQFKGVDSRYPGNYPGRAGGFSTGVSGYYPRRTPVFPENRFAVSTPVAGETASGWNGGSTGVENPIYPRLKGISVAEGDLWEASPISPNGDWREDFPLFLETLYTPTDRVNIVTAYSQRGGKASPRGFGKTLFRDEWVSDFRRNGVPQGEAGAWIRMNPVSGNGVSDVDVTAFRFALLEYDEGDIEGQLAFFAFVPLPIAALVTSAGKSIHAWVRIDCPDAGTYRETVSVLFQRLKPFGVDAANKNPSRLARLPGAQRAIGHTGDGRQRLLYLNPAQTACKPILTP